MSNFTLLAVPLFVYMGFILEKSGIRRTPLSCIEKLMRRVRGGIAYAVIIVGALLAASTGIVGATVVTMGVISLPSMLQRGFSKNLACGTIAASSTLERAMPPSIVLVLLGDMMNVDVGNLFAGAIFPGLILVLSYALYIFILSKINPRQLGQAVKESEQINTRDSIRNLLPTLGLILLVLGSILSGITPTEAAAAVPWEPASWQFSKKWA